MKALCCFVILGFFLKANSQPNCEAYKYYYKDTLKYRACKKAEQIEQLYQFSKAYQDILDESLEIDSTFAYAYNRKSVAYLKSGDFITWKKLTDKAVKYSPKEYLGHRGYIRFLCFRDYEGAIKDLEQVDSLVRLNIGYTAVGNDHLIQAKALCYKSIGNIEKAIQILEAHLNSEDHDFGLEEYLHLGVLYLENKQYNKALEAFFKQSGIKELAENQFYLALTYKALAIPSKYIEHLKKAKQLYLEGQRMFQDYIDPIDKIYLEYIEDEMEIAYSKHKNQQDH